MCGVGGDGGRELEYTYNVHVYRCVEVRVGGRVQ